MQSDQIVAMKSGDKVTLNVLRYIVAQLKYKEIEKQSELTDEEVVQALRKQIKELQEAVDAGEKAGRQDLVDENKAQIAIIQKYLPAEISDDELEVEVQKLVDANKDKIAANAKSIIGIAMGALKSKADPARIQAVLRKKQLM